MKNFESYMQALRAKVDEASVGGVAKEDVALHLYETSGRYWAQAQMMKHQAEGAPVIVKIIAQRNAEQLEQYSLECSELAHRMIGALPADALRRLRGDEDARPDAEVLPFVTPSEEN